MESSLGLLHRYCTSGISPVSIQLLYGIIARRHATRRHAHPGHWIAAATERAVDRGIDAVRVDVLAKELEVTRGSFYWHFKDREALLVAVLHAWRDGATEQVIERFEGQQADAAGADRAS